MKNKDEVRLIIGGYEISSWTSVEVYQGMESLPNGAILELAELYREDREVTAITPGDYVEIRLGDDALIKGYVDEYRIAMSSGNRSAALSIRGKCLDLTDCSAEWVNGQLSFVNAYEIAKKLVDPYGRVSSRSGKGRKVHPIEVISAVDPEELRIIQQLNVLVGETPFDILSRVCRYSALRFYENSDGNLVLSRAGTSTMSSGFEEGVNVESAYISRSEKERYSEYRCHISSIMNGLDGSDLGNVLGGSFDFGVKRNRKKFIVAEATAGFAELCIQRAVWERNARNGASETIHLTTDNWRDSAGRLWEPNMLVDVWLPSLRMRVPVRWLISSVNFKKGLNGTYAELEIVHPDTFSPAPMALEVSNLVDTSSIFSADYAPSWER